jgi:hypothetical protein
LLVNVATGRSYSLVEMVAMIAGAGGVSPEVIFDRAEEGGGDLVFDISGLRRHFPDFTPQPLGQGIGDYVAAMAAKGP